MKTKHLKLSISDIGHRIFWRHKGGKSYSIDLLYKMKGGMIGLKSKWGSSFVYNDDDLSWFNVDEIEVKYVEAKKESGESDED